jgi:hypothetical protein
VQTPSLTGVARSQVYLPDLMRTNAERPDYIAYNGCGFRSKMVDGRSHAALFCPEPVDIILAT